jgi:hypothetical protein
MGIQLGDIDRTIHRVDGAKVNFQASDRDEANATRYYGFLNQEGGWFIMEVTATTYRYAANFKDYTTNWTGRAGLTYSYYNEAF